jgi:exopolysaccharide production protein ExoQ
MNRPSPDAEAMADDFAPATPVREVRLHLMWLAAAAFVFASNAPSLVLGVYVLALPLSFETWPFIYAFTAASITGVILLWNELRQRPSMRTWPWPIWPLATFLIWTLLSVTWSVRADLTANRAIIAVGIAAFGAWFGLALRFREQLLAVTIFSVTVSTGSLAMVVFRPHLGTSTVDGTWQGVFANSNSLAPAAAVGILAAVGLLIEFRDKRILPASALLGGLNLVLLVRSSSFTGYFAITASVIVFAAFALIPRVKRSRLNGVVVGSIAAISTVSAGYVASQHISTIASAVGQDPTLSNRTGVWAASRVYISIRPVLGYGYWAFWESDRYSELDIRRYGSTHNSLLEVAVGLGLIGAAIFVVLVGTAVICMSRQNWRKPSLQKVWWMALLAALLAEHTTESFVLWHSYVWMLLVATVFVPFSREWQER